MTTEQVALLLVSNVLSVGFGAAAANLGLRGRVGRLEGKVGINENGSLTGNGLIGQVATNSKLIDALRFDVATD